MTGWQPIEKAPRDGTDVLVFDPECDQIVVAFWSEQYSGGWVVAAYDAFSVRPTHWMPLPEPPKETLENARKR